MEIQGYSGYIIYPDGRIWSNKLNREIKSTINNAGYYVVGLTNNKKRKLYLLHRLLAIHYIDNPENKPCVDHIDRVKTNNSLDNLRWVTHLQNCQNWGVSKRNTNGHKNIKFRKATGHYCFEKMVNGKQHSRTFKTLEEAVVYKNNYLRDNFYSSLSNHKSPDVEDETIK